MLLIPCEGPKGYTVPAFALGETVAIAPGRRLGPYEILSAIGAGGMREVEALWRPRMRGQRGVCVPRILRDRNPECHGESFRFTGHIMK